MLQYLCGTPLRLLTGQEITPRLTATIFPQVIGAWLEDNHPHLQTSNTLPNRFEKITLTITTEGQVTVTDDHRAGKECRVSPIGCKTVATTSFGGILQVLAENGKMYVYRDNFMNPGYFKVKCAKTTQPFRQWFSRFDSF